MTHTLRYSKIILRTIPGENSRFRTTMQVFDPNAIVEPRGSNMFFVETKTSIDDVKHFTSVDKESVRDLGHKKLTMQDFMNFCHERRFTGKEILMAKDHLNSPARSCDIIRNTADCKYRVLDTSIECSLGNIEMWESDIKDDGRGHWIFTNDSGTDLAYISSWDDIILLGFH